MMTLPQNFAKELNHYFNSKQLKEHVKDAVHFIKCCVPKLFKIVDVAGNLGLFKLTVNGTERYVNNLAPGTQAPAAIITYTFPIADSATSQSYDAIITGVGMPGGNPDIPSVLAPNRNYQFISFHVRALDTEDDLVIGKVDESNRAVHFTSAKTPGEGQTLVVQVMATSLVPSS